MTHLPDLCSPVGKKAGASCCFAHIDFAESDDLDAAIDLGAQGMIPTLHLVTIPISEI